MKTYYVLIETRRFRKGITVLCWRVAANDEQQAALKASEDMQIRDYLQSYEIIQILELDGESYHQRIIGPKIISAK
jgi:hypothetical protein